MKTRLVEDFLIYNDGNDFSVGSREATKKYEINQLIADKSFVAVGEFLSLELFEDNCVNVRVVVGDLTDQENDEWVGHVRSRLNLSCGELGVSSALVMFDSEPDETAFRFVQVPPGDYQVDIYAYFPSFTGVAANLTAELMGDESVPVGQWFRQTRPGEELPNWLIYECLESYDADPENEKYWEERAQEMDDEQRDELLDQAGKYVEFLIQLSPLQKDPLPPELYESGACKWNTRLLTTCPIGLYSEAIESDLA